MSTLRITLNTFRQDWKSDELRLIAAAVFISTACLTSVNLFTDRVKRATELQATELLAADLVLDSANPIPADYLSLAQHMGLTGSLHESFRSVVMVDDKLELAEVKAVDENYPVRGRLRISKKLFSTEYETTTVPAAGEVWLGGRLSQALEIRPGAVIRLGASSFKFTHVLNYEPDRGGDLFNIAPRLLMNRADLAATGLILPGSRVRYRLLLGGKSAVVEEYRNAVDTTNTVRIRGIKDVRPEINAALERAEQFLGLTVLVSIALAGMAIAMTTHSYVTRHFDNCAIMRCMGLQQNQIIMIYVCQLGLLALLAAVPGCATGFVAQEILNRIMAGVMEKTLPPPSFWPVVTGLLASLTTVLSFAMPQLLRLRQVPPMRILRNDLTPLPANNYLIYGLAILVLAVFTPWQSGTIKLTLYMLAGLSIVAILMSISAYLLITWLRKIQPALKLVARYGLVNVMRRAQRSIIQVVSVGIGVTVMLLLTLVRTDLLTTWENHLSEKTPNYFLINIQPGQLREVKEYISRHIIHDTVLYPMIRARLLYINDTAVTGENYKSPRAQRLATRDFNLSYLEDMQADNELISGHWWPRQRDENYFSVEQGIAETLGIRQGDTLTYQIAGQELSGRVINLRRVEWDSFNANFFVVANPESLQTYPATFITSFYMPGSKREGLIDLIRQFPSITVIDVDAILSRIRVIMHHVTNTIEFVFIFTLLAGITVLFATLQGTHKERIYESALMRALGAKQRQIVAGLFSEFLFIGLAAGLLSALAASALEIILATHVFSIDVSINPWIWIVGPLACCIIIIGAGIYGTRGTITASPMQALRNT